MSQDFDPRPITLQGQHVRLEPLESRHADDLLKAGSDPAIWRYMPSPPFETIADVQTVIHEALMAQQNGTQVPFATTLAATGEAIGSTRYLAISRPDRNLEIGWTWIAPAHQRSAVNTECKYLLLRHAFETLGAVRVQLKTDKRNERSQRAIERIGGVHEGILRQHMILWDGYIRDTVYYSILDSEWAGVKAKLEQKLK